MSNVSEEKQTFMDACLDTPFGAPCVKARGFNLSTDMDKKRTHGILVRPVIDRKMLNGPGATQDLLNRLVLESCEPYVKVRGHGWDLEVPFVWEGTPQEFNEEWECD